jgi:hypothetical protein
MTEAVRKQIVNLASHGFSYKVIRDETGYSTSTIANVLKKAGAQVRHYRNGKTEKAAELIQRCEVAINECRRLRRLTPRRWR